MSAQSLCAATEPRIVAESTPFGNSTGKTSLLRALREGLDGDTHRFCYLPTPVMSARALLRRLSDALGLPAPNAFAHVVPRLREHLWILHQRSITPVVCLDDAHAASFEGLEASRCLSNFDLDSQRVMALIFVGQPSFASHLQLPTYQALTQRMVQPDQLPPMHVDETAACLAHHLDRAGAQHPIFHDDTFALIHHATKGVARQINRLAEMALLQGAAKQQRPITRQLIQDLLDNIGTL